jgi:hypothetical protein
MLGERGEQGGGLSSLGMLGERETERIDWGMCEQFGNAGEKEWEEEWKDREG